MKNLATTNILLLVIAIALIVLAAKPLRNPHSARAQDQAPSTRSTASDLLYIEPGTVMLRSVDGNTQVFGKMVVDMNTGSIWGFPTLTGQPYPVDITSTKPPVSHPMFLGTFAFGDINK